MRLHASWSDIVLKITRFGAACKQADRRAAAGTLKSCARTGQSAEPKKRPSVTYLQSASRIDTDYNQKTGKNGSPAIQEECHDP
jgi:hypothetical protein